MLTQELRRPYIHILRRVLIWWVDVLKKPLMQIAYILGKLNTIYLPIDRRHCSDSAHPALNIGLDSRSVTP